MGNGSSGTFDLSSYDRWIAGDILSKDCPILEGFESIVVTQSKGPQRLLFSPGPMRPFQTTKESRRSTRVSLEVSIDVEDETSSETVTGATQVVNLHGALIRTAKPLRKGCRISITVYLTAKRSKARVVHVSPDNPLKAGIELEAPQNIWGVSLTPEDWDEFEAHR